MAFILVLSCRDQIGIVAAVASFLADRGFSIEESAQFYDRETGAFFMRTAFAAAGDPARASLSELEAGFAPIARRFAMDWSFHDLTVRPRIIVAVSKQGHCLVDLAYRAETGWLPADIAAVVSNHADLAGFAERQGLAFHHWPVQPETKREFEAKTLALMEETGAELLVLARYMQVLTPETCAALAGRCINIHHSFLPSFKGAHPYAQAHARGVKIIGATAHFVTPDLDEGPIIEQAVTRVAHHHGVNDLVEIGRDLESQVLARAVRWTLERRVMLSGARTVVFA